MPRIEATVTAPIVPSFRVHQVTGMFGMPLEAESRASFAVEVPGLDESWTIGAIVGPSGSGKSTIARQAFGPAVITSFPWPRHAAIIDGFPPCSIKAITQTLSAVGFSSPPAWLRPYHVLSNGERFRCDLARALLAPEKLVVCDEFTSVVDRTVAKVGSAALARTLRTGHVDKRFVAVTCHYDVLAWLEADWVVDMATGTLARGRLRRPPIVLRVEPAPQALWQRFARHHYLSGSLSRGARCYVALWDDEPVAFCAVIGQLGRRRHKRVTRLVTLPDFQGLGIGARLLERVAEKTRADGERISITTSHPAVCSYLEASPRWRCTGVRRCRRDARQIIRDAPVRDSHGRTVVSFEFIG